jgi:hypothetical protein
MNSMPERMARVETNLENLTKLLEKVSSTQDVIKAKVTKAETQVTFTGTLFRYAYPPGAALAVWIGAHMGLPLPR